MNRTLVIALVLGLSGTVFATAPAEPPSVAVGNGEGLSLLTTLGTNAPAEFLPGQAIPLEMQLVNTSKAHAYLVVKPGDGSESGWREPHVYYTAERSGADGGWTRMEPTQILRCGLYDDKWQKDVVTLKPGESLLLKDWLLPPSSAFEFQQVGRYRIRAHYAYRGGQGGKGNGAQTAEDVGGMQGIAPFEIVSSPVEVAVKRPLNVTLKVRRNLIADQPARLSDLLDIAVGNDSDKPINTAHPTLSAEGRLTLQMRAELGWGPTLDKQDNPHAAKMDIQPGQSMPLLGKGAFANGVDGTWTYPRAETVKLRAGYTPSTWKDVGTVWSDWVEVKVEPPPAGDAAQPKDGKSDKRAAFEQRYAVANTIEVVDVRENDGRHRDGNLTVEMDCRLKKPGTYVFTFSFIAREGSEVAQKKRLEVTAPQAHGTDGIIAQQAGLSLASTRDPEVVRVSWPADLSPEGPGGGWSLDGIRYTPVTRQPEHPAALQNDPSPNAGPGVLWLNRKTARTLFSAQDIVRFDWERQVFELSRTKAMDLDAEFPPHMTQWLEFEVRDADKLLYLGRFISPITSISYPGPTIMFRAANVAPPFYAIESGYPAGTDGTNQSDRTSEVKAALDRAGVLAAIPSDEKPRLIERLSTEWVGPQHGIKIRAEIFLETFRIGESARAHLFFDRIGQSSLPADIEIHSTVTAGEGKFFCTTEHTVQKPETVSEVLQRGTLILQWKPWGPNRGAVQAEARPGPAEVKFMVLMLDQEGKGLAELDIPAQKINILPRQAGGEWSNAVGLVGRLIVAEPKIPFGGRLRPILELRNAHYGGGPWLAVRTGYPHLIEVQIADADGTMIQPTVQRAEVLVRPMWAVIRPFPGETIEMPVGIEGLGGSNAVAHLSTVAGVWKLPPGRYKLYATYSSPSLDDIHADPGPQGATVWKGKLVLPPVDVEILPPATGVEMVPPEKDPALLHDPLPAQPGKPDEKRTVNIRADFIEGVQKMLPEGWSVERRVWSGSSGCTMVLRDGARPSSSGVHEGNAVLCILPTETDEQPGTADGRGKPYTPILKAANGTAHLWADVGNWRTIESDLAKALVGEPMPVAPFLVDFTDAAGVRQHATIRANWLQCRRFNVGLESFEKECRLALGRQPVADLRKVEINMSGHRDMPLGEVADIGIDPLTVTLTPRRGSRFTFGKVAEAVFTVKNVSDKAVNVGWIVPIINRSEQAIGLSGGAYGDVVKDHDADRYRYDGLRQMESHVAFHAGFLLPGQQVAIHTTYRPLFAVEQFRIQYDAAAKPYDGTAASLGPLTPYISGNSPSDQGTGQGADYIPFEATRWQAICEANPAATRPGPDLPKRAVLIPGLGEGARLVIHPQQVVKVSVPLDAHDTALTGEQALAAAIRITGEQALYRDMAYSAALGGYAVTHGDRCWLLTSADQSGPGMDLPPVPRELLRDVDSEERVRVQVGKEQKGFGPDRHPSGRKFWNVYPIEYGDGMYTQGEFIRIDKDSLRPFLKAVLDHGGRLGVQAYYFKSRYFTLTLVQGTSVSPQTIEQSMDRLRRLLPKGGLLQANLNVLKLSMHEYGHRTDA